MWLVSRLLLFLFFACSVTAQQISIQRKVELRNLQGLNTVAGDFSIKPNESRVAHNIDWGRNVGSLTLRRGYDSISVISGMDSILGIYGAYYSDGTQQLFVIADSAGVGYGNVYVTNKGSVNLSADSLTRIWQYWGVENRSSFAMHGDYVYIVNGQQTGLVYSNDTARLWPPLAPGEPLIVPLDDAGNLDGEYRYSFVYERDDAVGVRARVGYLSNPISVSSGKVLITNFPWVVKDSLATGDSVFIRVYRSRSDISPLDYNDSVFLIDTITVRATTAAALNAIVFTDNLSDDSLDNGFHTGLRIHDFTFVGTPTAGRFSASYTPRYGSPGFISSDTADTASGTGRDKGVYQGDTASFDSLYGWSYAVTFVDTITGIESDTGRSLAVYRVNPKDSAYTLVLPEVSAPTSGLARNLYRAPIYQFGFDTLQLDNWWDYGITDWYIVIPDSIVTGDYHLQGQYSLTGDTITDKISWDSLQRVPTIFFKSTPPTLTSKILVAESRMWAIEGAFVWKSALIGGPIDTLQKWFQADPIPINRSDGDQITLMYETRGALRVHKNFSNHNIFQNSALEWARTEISGTFGCIAPNSYAKGFGGHYYLSDAGIVRENEGLNLERTQSIELVSAPIKSFDQMSLIDKAEAIGFYVDRKYLLYVPAAGTTWVFDERANAISTWDIPFDGATSYGVETSLGFFPGDTMYFFTDSVLFRFGGRDGGDSRGGGLSPISATWESAPLFADNRYERVASVGVWDNSVAPTGYTFKVAVTDHLGTISDSTTFTASLGTRYRVLGVSTNNGLYSKIGWHCRDSSITQSFPIIDGFDIWYMDLNEVLVE